MNPYQAPAETSDVAPRFAGNAESVALGQRLVIYAILMQVAGVGLTKVLGPWADLIVLGALGMSLFGVFRVSTGLGYSTVSKVLIIVLMFVPIVSLITLAIVNSKATTALRASGYRVGLLGASKT